MGDLEPHSKPEPLSAPSEPAQKPQIQSSHSIIEPLVSHEDDPSRSSRSISLNSSSLHNGADQNHQFSNFSTIPEGDENRTINYNNTVRRLSADSLLLDSPSPGRPSSGMDSEKSVSPFDQGKFARRSLSGPTTGESDTEEGTNGEFFPRYSSTDSVLNLKAPVNDDDDSELDTYFKTPVDGEAPEGSLLARNSITSFRRTSSAPAPPKNSVLSAESRSRIQSKILNLAKLAMGFKPKYVPPRIGPYVSRNIYKFLLSRNAGDFEGPSGVKKTGVVLFSDASGFTKMTERLDKRVPKEEGVRELSLIINEFFTKLLTIVDEFGGDVIKFAGDALCIMWPVDPEEADLTNMYISPTMRTATLRACACAVKLNKEFDDYTAIQDPNPENTVKLSLHMGIGCGKLTSIHVGGALNRWENVIAGPPMKQIAIAEPLAKSRETVLSPEAYALVKDVVEAVSMRDLIAAGLRSEKDVDGNYDFMLLNTLRLNVTCPPAHPLPTINESVATLMHRYIPKAIIEEINSGMDKNIAEIKDVTVLFVQIHGVELGAPEGDTSNANVMIGQRLMLEVQRIVYHSEGSINKLLVDDKGLLFLCAFGLPPFFHHNDPVRGVFAALDLVQNLQSLGEGVHCSVGVSTGRAFCGVVGSPNRREYTMMGNVVNLAARLMGKAPVDGVYVDHATKTKCEKLVNMFEFTLVELELKGMAGVVLAYKPSFNLSMPKPALNQSSNETKMTGREEEMKKIEEAMRRLFELKGGTVVVTGVRGSGKNVVVKNMEMLADKTFGLVVLKDENAKEEANELVRLISSTLRTSLPGDGKASLPDKPDHNLVKNPSVDCIAVPHKLFSEWAAIIESLVKHASKKMQREPADWVRVSLAGDGDEEDLTEHLWMLQAALPLNSPVVLSGALLPPVFSHAQIMLMCKMVIRLIQEASSLFPLFIMLHITTGTNVQANVDPESWELASQLSRHCKQRRTSEKAVHPIILVVVTRPMVNSKSVQVTEIIRAAKEDNCEMQLRPLNELTRLQYAVSILSQKTKRSVGLAALPPELAHFLSDYAAGNPKSIKEYIEELLNKSHPAIEVLENGRVELLVRDLSDIHPPEKTQATVKQEFDQLSPQHRKLLKAASVFKSFTPAMLLDVLSPDGVSASSRYKRVCQDLAELVSLDVLVHVPTSMHVRKYFPRDLGESSCYKFVSTLQQILVERDMDPKLKNNIRETVNRRMNEVERAVVLLQSRLRAKRARMTFKKIKMQKEEARHGSISAGRTPSESQQEEEDERIEQAATTIQLWFKKRGSAAQSNQIFFRNRANSEGKAERMTFDKSLLEASSSENFDVMMQNHVAKLSSPEPGSSTRSESSFSLSSDCVFSPETRRKSITSLDKVPTMSKIEEKKEELANQEKNQGNGEPASLIPTIALPPLSPASSTSNITSSSVDPELPKISVQSVPASPKTSPGGSPQPSPILPLRSSALNALKSSPSLSPIIERKETSQSPVFSLKQEDSTSGDNTTSALKEGDLSKTNTNPENGLESGSPLPSPFQNGFLSPEQRIVDASLVSNDDSLMTRSVDSNTSQSSARDFDIIKMGPDGSPVRLTVRRSVGRKLPNPPPSSDA